MSAIRVAGKPRSRIARQAAARICSRRSGRRASGPGGRPGRRACARWPAAGERCAARAGAAMGDATLTDASIKSMPSRVRGGDAARGPPTRCARMSAVTRSQDATAPAAEPAPAIELKRLGLVVHPKREIDTALDIARAWADANGAEIVQIKVSGQERVVAGPGEVASCDIVLGVGGDGTTLHALHAAASVGRPVLGVACGSLGALTAVAADELDEALEAVATGRWRARRLPGLRITGDHGLERIAINDLVVIRRGPSQVIVGIYVDDQLYVRFAGDGIVVATPAGSSAYTLAAGGPILAERSDGLVLTPLAAPGGGCPPLVVGSSRPRPLPPEPRPRGGPEGVAPAARRRLVEPRPAPHRARLRRRADGVRRPGRGRGADRAPCGARGGLRDARRPRRRRAAPRRPAAPAHPHRQPARARARRPRRAVRSVLSGAAGGRHVVLDR